MGSPFPSLKYQSFFPPTVTVFPKGSSGGEVGSRAHEVINTITKYAVALLQAFEIFTLLCRIAFRRWHATVGIQTSRREKIRGRPRNFALLEGKRQSNQSSFADGSSEKRLLAVKANPRSSTNSPSSS